MGWPKRSPAQFPAITTDISLFDRDSGQRIKIETNFSHGLIDRDASTTVEGDYVHQLYAYLASEVGRGSNHAVSWSICFPPPWRMSGEAMRLASAVRPIWRLPISRFS